MRLLLLDASNFAFDADGALWVLADFGCHAGEWLRHATVAEERLWLSRGGEAPQFRWRVPGGGWKRLADVAKAAA